MELCRVAILDQIHRLTNDPLSDHSQDVQKLKSEYNRLVTNDRNEISAAPREILDIFPPEVWIQIVKEALPMRGYSFALLLLATVSRKWMQALISIPTLWAYIELRGSQEDSLATVEAFRQLSCEVPVHLSIYVPARHDQSTIYSVLMSIGPRIREVTIRLDVDIVLRREETCAGLQLLLNGSQFNPSLTYIHLEYGAGFPLHHESTSEFMKNNPLPASLRAIHGWNFEWRNFRTKADYLERLEVINSCSPIESVISHQIQLPNLRSLTVDAHGISRATIKPEDEEGFPPLENLMSLTYFCAYRGVLMRLLVCIAPQLIHLNLGVPYTKIPSLVSALQIASNLRTLTVQTGRGERENERDFCPVHQQVTGRMDSLRVLELCIVSDDEPPTPEQAERRAAFLGFLIWNISGLYTKVESLRFDMLTKYPIAFDAVMSYVESLPELRTLHAQWLPGYFPDIQGTYTLWGLECLNTINIDFSNCIRTPNLLYLKFIWGYHQNLDTLTYPDLRRLFIDAYGSSVVEIHESSFPSLQELNVYFPVYSAPTVYGCFKLTSFPFLRSITIGSRRSQPQGTMLCFALLNHPGTCPSLSEIEFRWCFPDLDILFLMLEKRNFMVDSAVSLIRRITVPFIPAGLCAPLASLLGGVYAERPSNNDLFMGGARELLLDEQVPGCTECLMRMMGGCKCRVGMAMQGDVSYQDNQHGSMREVKLAWTEILEYGDPTTLDWMVQRRFLLEEFIFNLATWSKKHHREARCQSETTAMEITEYGVITRDYRR